MIYAQTVQWSGSKRVISSHKHALHTWLLGSEIRRTLRAAETTTVKYRLGLSDIGDHHVAIMKTLDRIPRQSKMSMFTHIYSGCNYHNPPSPLGQERSEYLPEASR